MKKNYQKYVTCLIASAMSCTLFVNYTLAFNSNTHKNVTQKSLKIVSEINSDEFYIFNKEDEKYWEIVAEYSVKPDEDENQGAYKYHFYNPVTQRNFMGEKNSALLKCLNHFNEAVGYYKKGNKNMAYQELGRSIHFMEDLNTPVHTAYDLPSDAVIKFPLHVRFEKTCDKICEGCLATVPKESLNYFSVNPVETIAKSSAVLSADNFYYLENDEETEEESLAKNAVLNAQHKVTGICYKFFKQIQINS